MTIYQVLSLLGTSSIFTGFIGYLIARVNSAKKETDALKDGMQSLLRHSLLSSYTHCKSQKYKTMADTEAFDHMFISYTALGGNGAMVNVKAKFDALDIMED